MKNKSLYILLLATTMLSTESSILARHRRRRRHKDNDGAAAIATIFAGFTNAIAHAANDGDDHYHYEYCNCRRLRRKLRRSYGFYNREVVRRKMDHCGCW